MADFGGSVGGGEFFRGILQVSWASGEYSSSRVRARCAGGQAAACLRLSCARSWPACRRIQKSASDQPTRSNANASRGLILPVPAKSRCRVFLETPSRFAAVVTLHPVSSIAIRMVSPGCAGFNIAIAVPGFLLADTCRVQQSHQRKKMRTWSLMVLFFSQCTACGRSPPCADLPLGSDRLQTAGRALARYRWRRSSVIHKFFLCESYNE